MPRIKNEPQATFCEFNEILNFLLMNHFDINPEIASANCLPTRFYTDGEYFERSRDLIFARTWQFAALRNDVDNVVPVTLLEGFMDEPLILADEDGLSCFSNVCTHRGNLLVTEKCHLTGIRCGYHGRKFDLKGKFVSMPEFEGVSDFPGPDDNLRAVEIGEWAGLVFASFDPAASFGEFLAPVTEEFSGFSNEQVAEISAADYEVNAHWALYCENYLEGFHIPYVHKSLNREIEYESYKTRTFRYGSLQTADRSKANDVSGRGMGFEERAAFYFFVFPNLMFNFYPWGLSLNIVEPLTLNRTRVRYISLIVDPEQRAEGAGGDLETVEYEDQRVVESVQKGINSRLYRPGRYSVTRETGTHHFHLLIAEFMNNGESK